MVTPLTSDQKQVIFYRETDLRAIREIRKLIIVVKLTNIWIHITEF